MNPVVPCALLCAAMTVALAACSEAPPPKPPAPVQARGTSPQTTAPQGSAPRDSSGAPSAQGGASRAPAPAVYKVSGPDDDPTLIEVAGITMRKPVTWVWTKPAQSMRTLQYAVPATDRNAPAAELIISVFAGNDGGPLEGNLQRWAGFFRQEDGSEAPAERSQLEAGDYTIWRQESRGAYMGMGQAAPRPGYAQLGAIIETGDQRIFLRLVGPQESVESNRAAFDEMLRSVR